MSELQNKAVQFVLEREGNRSFQHAHERSEAFLRSALELFIAIGGKKQAALVLTEAAAASRPLPVAEAVANVMLEVAVASQLSDLDMVQAVNVRIDARQAQMRRS